MTSVIITYKQVPGVNNTAVIQMHKYYKDSETYLKAATEILEKRIGKIHIINFRVDKNMLILSDTSVTEDEVTDKSCDTCCYTTYESCNLNGYCNNPRCFAYRKMVVDDRGCKIKFCNHHNSCNNNI